MIPCVYYREGWADQVSRFFTEFLEDKDDLEIVMENVLDEDWCLLLDVYKKVDHPKFKLCLDMGHAHCYSEIPVMEWAEGSLRISVMYTYMITQVTEIRIWDSEKEHFRIMRC